MQYHSGRGAARRRPTAVAFPACTFPPDFPGDGCGNRRTASLFGHEFLTDPKLRIFWKEDFGGEVAARCEIASGDVFLVFYVLTRIYKLCVGMFLDLLFVDPITPYNYPSI